MRRNRLSHHLFEATVDDLTEGEYHAWIAQPSFHEDKKSDGPDEPDSAAESNATDHLAPPSCDFNVEAEQGEHAKEEIHAKDLRRAAKDSDDPKKENYFTVANADKLANEIPEIRPFRTEPLPPVTIWNAWFVPLLFVGLIVTEWLLRKKAGML